MTMIQLAYVSRPFGFDDAMLNGILIDARRSNARDGITGALICRADMYLQMLEGPRDAVEAAYKRIERDDRHTEVRHVAGCATEARMFGDWAMRDDPAQSWMWTREEVEDGALEHVTEDEVMAVFARLAKSPPVPARS